MKLDLEISMELYQPVNWEYNKKVRLAWFNIDYDIGVYRAGGRDVVKDDGYLLIDDIVEEQEMVALWDGGKQGLAVGYNEDFKSVVVGGFLRKRGDRPHEYKIMTLLWYGFSGGLVTLEKRAGAVRLVLGGDADRK